MSVCWGIVRVRDRARLDRWRVVVAAGLTPRLVIPVGREGVEITRGDDGQARERGVDVAEVLAEVALLATDDVIHRDVERRFDGFSVFLPDAGGVRALPAAAGFESNATACGATRLLALSGNEVIDVQLRAAAQLALVHGLAIEFSY